MTIPFMRQIAWYLVFAMFVIGIAPRVDAGMAPSELIALQQVDREADLAKVQKVLENKMVRERLQEFGYSPDEIDARVSQLSDQQLHELALQIDDLKVGGDALGVIIAILVIILLIVLILHFTGHKVSVQ